MKKLVVVAAILGGSISALSAAGLSLSNLGSGGAVKGTDLFYDVQTVGVGGVKVTGSQIATFVWATPTFTGTVTFPDTSTWGSGGLSTLTNLTVTRASVQTITVSGLNASTQCLQVTTGSTISGTGVPCSSGGGTPGGSTGQVQFNNGGALAGDSSFTITTPGQLTLNGGTITSNSPVKLINITQIWNNNSVAFDAPFFMNITNTASASGQLIDLEVNSGTVLSISRPVTDSVDGQNDVVFSLFSSGLKIKPTVSDSFKIDGTAAGASGYVNLMLEGTGNTLQVGMGNASEPTYGVANRLYIFDRSNLGMLIRGAYADHAFAASADFGWGFSSGAATATIGSIDTVLYRDAAASILALGNRVTPTTGMGFRLYNTVDTVASNTVAVNYERGAFDWTTSVNTLTIGSQANGSGLGRTVMLVASGTKAISLSPTINIYGQSNPGANETYAVCAGSGATSLTAGGQLFVDTTACLASSMLVKHDIAAFNDYGMTKLASIAEPLHARNRLATSPIEIDPIAEAMALVPAVATYDTLGSGGPEFTLIAQNVCQVDERLCERTRSGEIRTFKPNSVISILVAAIQKQQSEIDELKRRLH